MPTVYDVECFLFLLVSWKLSYCSHSSQEYFILRTKPTHLDQQQII